MKKIIILVLMIVSTALAFGAKEGLEKGNKLPVMKLYDTSGKEVKSSLDYLEKGKITIFNFGASWCPPCKVEKPVLNKFYLANKDKINVVSIMVDNNGEAVDKFYTENHMDFPHFWDKNQVLSRIMLIRVVPTSYIVDENGVILERVNGALDWSKLTVEDIKALK